LLSALLVAIASGASPALAEVSAQQLEFARGPASHWFTGQDKEAWKKVQTDAEAEDFAAFFWARRDPDPSTPVNEFRQEFEARVAYADREFKEKRGKEEVRGAMSDRGKVLILLGTPTKVSRTDTSGFDELEGAVDVGGGGSDGAPLGEYYRAAREGWRYEATSCRRSSASTA
jgi:GWxTD domain-containing protein